MTKQDFEIKYGRQPDNDSQFVKKCRLHQSWYRVEECREEKYGPWRIGGDCVGSALVDGKTTGKNFISPRAFEYAQEKVREKRTINPDLTIDEYRLFNNMLSSQPMCFNLFADLRAGMMSGNINACAILRAMFAESQIDSIEHVEVEMMPQPKSELIGDKTAFDAAILFTGRDGRNGIAAIETKYTDNLGGNRAKDETLKLNLSRELGIFTPEGLRYFEAGGFNQIARNFLLTIAYSKRFNRPNAINYVLALGDDDEAKNSVEILQGHLAKNYCNYIRFVPLEEIVSRGLPRASVPHVKLLRQFEKRYLSFKSTNMLIV